MQLRKQQLELDMKQQTGSKSGKEARHKTGSTGMTVKEGIKGHALLTMPKTLTVWITINCGKI